MIFIGKLRRELLLYLSTFCGPRKANKDKEQATKALYDMLYHYVDIRQMAEVPSWDAIDVLIAGSGDNLLLLVSVSSYCSPTLWG